MIRLLNTTHSTHALSPDLDLFDREESRAGGLVGVSSSVLTVILLKISSFLLDLEDLEDLVETLGAILQ